MQAAALVKIPVLSSFTSNRICPHVFAAAFHIYTPAGFGIHWETQSAPQSPSLFSFRSIYDMTIHPKSISQIPSKLEVIILAEKKRPCFWKCHFWVAVLFQDQPPFIWGKTFLFTSVGKEEAPLSPVSFFFFLQASQPGLGVLNRGPPQLNSPRLFKASPLC